MSSVIGPFAANNQPGLQPHFVEAVCLDLSEFEQMLLDLSRALNCSSQLGAFAQKEDKNMSDLDSIQFIELERLHLIHAGADAKTVRHPAKNSKVTMDICAKVKYNDPEALSETPALSKGSGNSPFPEPFLALASHPAAAP